jgi:ketosteroid isomerase-like protein
MAADDNRALVLRFYRHMADLEFEQMFALMADDGVWTVAGRPESFHHAGACSKAERKAACLAFMEVVESMEMDVLSTTAEGDRVAIELRTLCRARNGVVYDQEGLHLVRCREGRVVSVYEQIDQQATLGFERAYAAASICD